MKVISLGWGIQSFTLAAMVALGEMEPIDAAIFADTTHERSETYKFAERWTPWLEEREVVVVVVATHEKANIVDKWGGMQIPAYTTTEHGAGQIRRQCTYEWKTKPMRQWLQANRNRQPVEQWLGISLDEYTRMKDSDVKYITHRWPLIEKRMTRKDCVAWLKEHNLEVPVKSSCVFCPYHNRAAWQEMAHSDNGDWQKAVAVDEAIRKVRPPYDLYVHPSRKPLAEIDFRTPQEQGQTELWANWDEECSGICGV